MFGWFKRRKLKMIGTSDWVIRWIDEGTNEKGMWLYYQSESGKREFKSSYIPWVYKGMGGEKRLPGYNDCLKWVNGGTLPVSFQPLKEIV
ncbi:hypothetical protein [Salmonella phage SSE121]|uniref:Uncharacterized protein n=2 Tax=Seunavirus TaxID=1914851 RepID=K4I3M5_9CAUD|nr:hypothetical protein ACQ19_gp151 [Salmonella phage SSE121]AFU63792.1 hypothetical protein [Salmonella phage SSE121]QXL90477.1 hypothetical protein [Salmonella phage NINP13076]